MNKKFHILMTAAVPLLFLVESLPAKDDDDKKSGRQTREMKREDRREERQEGKQTPQKNNQWQRDRNDPSRNQDQKGQSGKWNDQGRSMDWQRGSQRPERNQDKVMPGKERDSDNNLWQRGRNDQFPRQDVKDGEEKRKDLDSRRKPDEERKWRPHDRNWESLFPGRDHGGNREIPSRDWRDRDDSKKHGEKYSREKVKEREGRWKERGKNVRVRFNEYRKRDHIFDDYFWKRFKDRHKHWHFDNRFHWSVEATWPNVVVWLPWKWSQPVYYYYGSNGMIYYSEHSDYTYLVPVGSNLRFIAEAVRIANAPRPLSIPQSSWMPLGMYALSYDKEGTDMPSEYLTLAISKEGAVSGAYINVKNSETLEIQGTIDPKSQRVAWKFIDQDWPIMESGLYNLTKDESTLLVHTSSHRTEPRVIVRVR